MPTKINKSPNKNIGSVVTAATKANPLGVLVTGAKGALGSLTGGIAGVKGAIQDLEKGEFKQMKFGEKLKTIGKIYGKGMLGTLGGAAQGLIGTDFGLVDKGEGNLTQEEEQPKYTTNIDPMTGQEIPLTMTGKQKPIKALTQMQGTVAHNMSAKQYNKALQMKEISGAATMMTGDEKKGELTEKQKMEMDKQERPLYTMMRMPVRNVQKIQT